MTKHYSRRIAIDVLLVLIPLAMITIAATIPTPFDLVMERTFASDAAPAALSDPNPVYAQSKCQLRSTPLQWNVDWPFRQPTAPG
jgi:hypothetical protein